ncbi:hypothetical protein HFO56_00560 [Rhizobium laguerreae]|uniref:hypothetical protein n=1 Tax=Rhizobium laguerreae TaxID=1076926 RepID=UPI001C90ACF7|nr:hypothetical protein [Rhizobium laguerreae]MBY3150920.1 hypothetical protein [Rhizobium laguerreae]MBY3433103.1 hypothetical protein [Rhizobium laguerreae]
MTDTSIPAFPSNIKAIAGHSPNRRRMVSLFAGWAFIRFREGNDESFPVMPVYEYDCPTFEFNPTCASLEHLENPTFAPFWLPLALSKICTRVLAQAMNDQIDGDVELVEENRGERLVGEGWDNFRAEVCKQCDMTMDQLMIQARVHGFEKAVLYMTQCIYYETGLHAAIEARQSGRPVLRSA